MRDTTEEKYCSLIPSCRCPSMRDLSTPCKSLIKTPLFNYVNSAIRKQLGDGVYGRLSSTARRKGALLISPLFPPALTLCLQTSSTREVRFTKMHRTYRITPAVACRRAEWEANVGPTSRRRHILKAWRNNTPCRITHLSNFPYRLLVV